MTGLCSFKPTTTYLRCYYICIALIRNYSSFFKEGNDPSCRKEITTSRNVCNARLRHFLQVETSYLLVECNTLCIMD